MVINLKFSAVGDCELSEYQYFIDNFSSDEILGIVDTSKDAVEKTEKIWEKIYGKSVKDKKSYQVSYAPKNEVWLVQGTLTFNKDGGVPCLIIERKTGKVLALWHGK